MQKLKKRKVECRLEILEVLGLLGQKVFGVKEDESLMDGFKAPFLLSESITF